MTRGAAALVLVASIVGGAAGGAAATVVLTRILPAPGTTAAPGASEDVAAAAAAIAPAVVTVVITRGNVDAWGSGVVIDKARGHIVTNQHIVEIGGSRPAKDDITIILSDGRTLGATVIGTDPRNDIAVLRAQGTLPAQAELATTVPAVGARVIAIGTPGTQLTTSALANTVQSGIVSATGRKVPRADDRNTVLADLIQTDASIGDGMSGGPLVLVSTKQIVGVSTSYIHGQMDLGFAVSAPTVRRAVDEIVAKGSP